MALSVVDEAAKVIQSIRFSLLSPTELRKLSAVEIQAADTYDEDGVPIVSGLMDGRLGTLEPRQKCKTCGNTASACPGHFGHIELAEPVIHVSFAKLIHRLLSITCRNCGRILLTEEKIEKYRARYTELKQRLNTVPDAFLDEIIRDAKKTQQCPHCSQKQYPIEHGKPTTFHEIVAEGGAVRLTPSTIRERLERITDDDLILLGLDPKAARPEWAVLQVMPVPPVSVRPSITLESGIRSEDDLTHKLVDIIRINQKLREALESGVPINIIQELHELLQYHVTTYFDNEVSGLPPARHRSGRALKTLVQRLKGKEGRFRGNLSGKRVDFSARTVVSPDPNLDINEVGVPLDVASRLTIPEKVTGHNIEEMKRLIDNGPDNYPGALYIVRPDGRRVRLEFVTDRKVVAEAIQPGFVVERHLRDGDIVLFNRQPSLHRMSIMAHRVRVLPYKTFRLNPTVCPPYNADFDGDEMNLHVPQGEEARTEARLLMQVQDQILSPRYGGPIIGAIRDSLTAGFLLTQKSTLLDRQDVSKLFAAAGFEEPIPEPAVTKPEERWTGKQIFSIVLPKGFNFVSKSNLSSYYKCEDCDRGVLHDCPYDAFVVIKDGVLLQGVIDKASIGAEKSESLFHRIVKDYGAEEARRFLNSVTRLLDRYMLLRGFTYAMDELQLPPPVKEKITRAIEKQETKVDEYIDSYRKNTLERLPGQSLEESLEIYIMNELSRARDLAGEIADQFFQMDNSGVIMSRAGARGSSLNIGQMTANVGQQSIRGKRILRGYRGRALSFFKPGDMRAAARGFVYHSYRDGLDPIEFFFHAMGGREGLVDTAVRTQQSGYMQRRLINALEHLRVEYDSTVRDSRGNIVQVRYGEDGVDTAKSDHGKAVNIDRLVERVRLTMKKGTAAGKEYVEEQVEKAKEVLSPLILNKLRQSLLSAKLTKAGVDDAVEGAIENYKRALVEPGEAAGIVSAQSIGEPGTQMSIAYQEQVIVRERGQVRVVQIGQFVDDVMQRHPATKEDETEWCDLPSDMQVEVPSLSPEGAIKWKPIRSVSRHRHQRPLIRITTRSGRAITATDNHSFVTRINRRLIPILGRELVPGDRIPVLKHLPVKDPLEELRLDQVYSKTTYWFGSELTKARDLGTNWHRGYGVLYQVPVETDQLRNQLMGHSSFVMDDGFVYPYQNHNESGLPELLNLNGHWGWLIGAYLSEGSAARYSVSISNVEESFLARSRAIAKQLEVGFSEKDNLRGWGLGHDLTLRSSLLSEFLVKTCGKLSQKHIPGFALGAGDEFVGMLLRAYFDGDGSVDVRNRAIRASSRSRELIDGIALLLTRFGILASKSREGGSSTLWIPHRFAQIFKEKIGSDSVEKKRSLETILNQSPRKYTYDVLDMTCGFGSLLYDIASRLGIPTRRVNNFTKRQRIGRATLARYIQLFENKARERGTDLKAELGTLNTLLKEDVAWDEIVDVERVELPNEKVYDFSVPGLETFVTAEGVVTHNTLRTFHFAGVREQNVTLGLPRLIEIVDARKIPSTPNMTVYLDPKHRTSREKAQEVATLLTHTTLGDIASTFETDVTHMRVDVKLNPQAMREREVSVQEVRDALALPNADVKVESYNIEIKAKDLEIPQFRRLVSKLNVAHIKGIPAVKRALVVEEKGEWIVRTEGSSLALALEVPGVDTSRTVSNSMNETAVVLGIEAARNVIVKEALGVLEEQGLDVDVRHVMLVADMMTSSGDVLQVGRHGVSGEKASTLAKAAFEITIPTIVDAAVKGITDTLRGVAENVIVGQQIPMGTGLIEVSMMMPRSKAAAK